MNREKCFKVHELADLDHVADELDKAFDSGWRFIAHFNVGRGVILILNLDQQTAAASEHANGKTKAKVKATA